MGGEWIASVKFRLGRSMPSLVHWLTNTMAICEAAANAAGVAGLVPGSNCTVALGAIARMACRGDDGSQITCAQQGGQGYLSVRAGPPVGTTCAEPPPERTATSACDPTMAMDFAAPALSGSCPPAFFSSTAPCSSASCAMAWSPVVSIGVIAAG